MTDNGHRIEIVRSHDGEEQRAFGRCSCGWESPYYWSGPGLLAEVRTDYLDHLTGTDNGGGAR